jgi:outer membrane protein TolC
MSKHYSIRYSVHYSNLVAICVLACCAVVPTCAQELLRVNDAVRRAVQKNYDIIIASDEAEAARRGDSWATAGAYPSATAGASVNTARVAIDQKFSSGTTARQRGVEQTSTQAFAHMQWRVFDGMKMFATKERLAQIRERGESALRQQVSATILTTMSTYFALVQTDEQLWVTERMLQMVEERKRIADVRLSSGLSSRSDVLQARIDVNDALASLVSLRAQRRQTEISLLRCMGQDSSGSVRCADTVQVDSTINLAALRAALATANESVLQALSNIRISQAAKREAASAGYPGLELQAGYVFNRSQNSAGFALFN